MIPQSSHELPANPKPETTSITNQRSNAFRPALAVLLALALGLMSATQAGAITVGSSSNPGGLQAAIQTAYNNGNTQITVTPGTYYETGTLQLNGMTGLTLIGTGVTLCPTPTQQFTEAVNVYNCSNCTVEGFTVAYQVPQNPQATIMDIGSNSTGNYVDVQMMSGYPAPASDFQGVAYIFDQHTSQWKVGTGDSYGNTVTSGPNGLSRVYLSSASSASVVGDFLTGRGGSYHMFEADNCTNCTFQNLTVYYGGLFQFLEVGGGSNKWYNLVIEYGPTPSGATIPPLMSTEADGFHSTGTTTGPDIENCNFEGMPDDAISIHGTYFSIYSVPDSYHLIVNGGSSFNIANYDTVCVQNSSPNYFVSDTCTSAVSITTPNGAPAGSYYELTLQNSISTPSSGSMVYSYSRCGNGFKVINNTISHNRARGVRVLASNGVVQNNTFNGTTMEAILVDPVFSTGDPEAGVAENDQITGNTIIGTGQAYGGGAIEVNPDTPVAQNLTINGNTFSDVYGNVMSLTNTSSDTVTNNTISNPNSLNLSATGPNIYIDSTATNISESGNVITSVLGVPNATYELISARSGLALDNEGDNATNGVDVWQYAINASYNTNQQWQLSAQANGSFVLQCKTNNLALDNDGSTEDGGYIWQWNYSNGNANQQWVINDLGNGYCSLICNASGMALDNTGGTGNETPVWQWNYSPSNANQQWAILPTTSLANGTYKLISRRSGLALDNTGDGATTGVYVWQWPDNAPNNTNQQWQITAQSNGSYVLQCKTNNLALDNLGSTQAGAYVAQWTYNGSSDANQQWQITPLGNGYYSLVSKASGLALDNTGGTATNKTNVCQSPYNSSAIDQQWAILPVNATDP